MSTDTLATIFIPHQVQPWDNLTLALAHRTPANAYAPYDWQAITCGPQDTSSHKATKQTCSSTDSLGQTYLGVRTVRGHSDTGAVTVVPSCNRSLYLVSAKAHRQVQDLPPFPGHALFRTKVWERHTISLGTKSCIYAHAGRFPLAL